MYLTLRLRFLSFCWLLVFTLFFVTVFDTPALNILPSFIAPGNAFPHPFSDLIAEGEPTTVAGEGNLIDIFNVAVESWEMAILDDFDLTLYFGWDSLNNNKTLARHQIILQGGTPHREIEGIIRFDSDGSTNWFLDPTPRTDEEYGHIEESVDSLEGNGLINTGRIFMDPTGDAIGNFDLLSVAMHEIEHALGLQDFNTAYRNETEFDNDIDVTAPRPFPGAEFLPIIHTFPLKLHFYFRLLTLVNGKFNPLLTSWQSLK